VNGKNINFKEINMKHIAEGVFFIQGQDEFIPDAHVYVIGEPASEDLTLVDAGLMGKGMYKIEAIQKLGLSLSDIKRVILTHTHLDHIGCLREILNTIPHAELWVHTVEAAPLEQGDDRTVYGMDMFKNMCQSQYGIKPGAFTFKVDRKLEGGEILEMGNMAWEVIHIPGHSEGSIALYNRPGKILIPGDVVYADYAIGRFDLHGANGPALRDSLRTLAKLKVDVLLPGHNRVVENVQPGYIMETANQWAPYLT
jgi:hydroxyacylglutathione hydrolase